MARVLFHPFLFFPEEWNGLDEHLLLLSRYLDRTRFELSVLIHPADGPQTRILAERGGIRGIAAPYPAGAGARERLAALRRLYRAEHFDLLHIHSPVAGGQAVTALAARLAGVAATIATYHQIQPHRLAARSRLVNRLTHTWLVDRTTAVSADVRQTLASAAGLPLGRIEVIPNGIEPPGDADEGSPIDVPPRAPDEVRLGYFGRLSPEKGVDGLLDALALVVARRPNARTFIVGDGPDRAALRAQAVRLGLADQVEFLGFRSDARAIMRSVDVVVHAPRYEGFGLVVAEAMAAGRPVVGNDAPGGVKDMVVAGQTGLLASAGSADSLARAIVQLIDAPAERVRMGELGRQRFAQRFSARGMAGQFARLYEQVLTRR